MSIEIKLSRSNRIYRPDEPLEGKVIFKLNSGASYQSIRITIDGAVNLQVRGGSAGVIESVYGMIKPIQIMNSKKVVDVRSSGKLGSGTTEIPFSVILKDRKEENLEKFYETYHGNNVNIQYLMIVDVVRGYLHKPLAETMEFIVESEKDNLLQKPVSPEMVFFYITQDTQRHQLLPELKSGSQS
ncbi:Down syndrome critical region protein 3 [Dorcoceras hygrometricum]|uniref:Vacuolar protein sorting-associated protein 26C n=1 Tax=Dorcoceras hygrometricum TaxID=472368 RepID=A0A2Z7B023_9LAMI|nr:Down syndrome critical region protein 3 [Dorcoceras hygrometricum]